MLRSQASGTTVAVSSTSSASGHMPCSYRLLTPVRRVLVSALPSSSKVRNGKVLAITNRISAASVSSRVCSMLSRRCRYSVAPQRAQRAAPPSGSARMCCTVPHS